MGVLRPGMGGKAPRELKATSPEQIECFDMMTKAARTNDLDSLQTSIQQLENLIPPQEREGKQLHELKQALKIAIREGHLEVSEALLKVPGISANDFFAEILASQKAVNFLDLFASHGLRIDEIWSRGGIYPSWYDAIPDRLEALEWLLLHGADVNYDDPHCETPLDRAAEHGSVDAVKFLLDRGADVEQSNVLYFAAGSKRCKGDDPTIIALIEYLLNEVGIDVNSLSDTDEKETALHRAVDVASRTRVSTLLDHGADVAIEDEAGLNPLQYASKAAKDNGSEEYKGVAQFLDEWIAKREKDE